MESLTQRIRRPSSLKLRRDLREVQHSEFTVILNCGGVISLCGIYFRIEIAKQYSFSLKTYSCLPFASVFSPADAFVF
jgi:hypothetical protein